MPDILRPMSPKSKQDDPAQSKRFIETARKIGADETGAEFERAFKKIVPPKKPHAKPVALKRQHKSH